MNTATTTQVGLTLAGRQRLHSELARLLQQSVELEARLQEEIRQNDDDPNRYLTHQEIAQVKSRIAELKEVLDISTEAAPVTKNGVVAVGSQVTVRDEAGKEQSFTIVSPIEMDATLGYISFTSPVGAAVMD